MRLSTLALVLLPCAAFAAQPAYPQAIIDRPLVLPAGVLELGLQGDFTALESNSGFAAAGGLEYGLGNAQVGLAVAVPIEGFTFGSIYGSASAALEKQVALRFDIGYDRVVAKVPQVADSAAVGLLTVGFGIPFEVRLSHNLSFISGRVGAMSFAHFIEISGGQGDIYEGAAVPFAPADLLVVTKAFDGGSQISMNLPVGLLVQVADPFAIVFRAGYQALIFPDGGEIQHFLPLGFDATLSPTRDLDLGASFLLPGYVGGAGFVTGSGSAQYTNFGVVSLWLRLRT